MDSVTAPAENNPDRAPGTPADRAPEESGNRLVRPPLAAAAADIPALPAADSARILMEEVRARLSDLAARERQLEEREQALLAEQRRQQEQRALIAQTLAGLAEREAGDDRQVAELERRIDEKLELISRRKAELLAQVRVIREQLQQRQVQLGRDRETLQQQAAELAHQREQLRQVGQALRQRQGAVAAETRELQRQRAELEAQATELAGRADELEQREAALARQAADVETRRAGLDRDAEALMRRQAEVEKLCQQATQAREAAQRRQRELDALAERLRAREVELRDQTLQTELEREQLERQRAALAAEREQLDRLREQLERQPAAREQPTAREPRCWRRGLVLCGALGLIAAVGWLYVERPAYRGYAELCISGAGELRGQGLALHAGRLLGDELVDYWQGPPPAAAWLSARAEGRLSVEPRPDQRTLLLRVDTRDATLARTLLPAAVRAYGAWLAVEGADGAASRPAAENRWAEALNELRQRAAEIRARLAAAPGPTTRAAVEDRVDATLARLGRVGEELRARRSELVALQSQELPRGAVDPESFAQALADDAVYQEDLKELHAELRAYRTELAVALVLPVDPLRELRAAAQALAGVLVEQRDLQPPAEVRAVLESSLEELEDFNYFLAEFARTWEQQRETIERLKEVERIEELFHHQQQAVAAAERAVAESRRVISTLERRVEALTGRESAGTRALVVAAVLRGDLSTLAERVAALAEAAKATDPAANFRLDAHRRQLQALRTRLAERQAALRRTLQAAADRQAQSEHRQRERRLREQVSGLEQQRQELFDTLLAEFRRLRQLDRQRREAEGGPPGTGEAELRATEALIARLEQALSAPASRPAPPSAEQVHLADSGWKQTAGRHRGRNAALAGVAGLALGAVFLLLTGGRGPRGGI